MQINKAIQQQYEEIKTSLKELGFEQEDIKKVTKAMNYAIHHHEGQMRSSGDPYVTHPMHVCQILMSWGLDIDSFIAGLLHDVVEDTQVTLDDIRNHFGENVMKLVDAVTKVKSYSAENRDRLENTHNLNSNQEDQNIETIMKVFLGMSKDIRVILIKLADRLHNMRTIEFRKKEKQIKKAIETREVYANIAARLGMYEVKTELNNICLKILEPNEYKLAEQQISDNLAKYQEVYNEAIFLLESTLEANHIEAKVTSRIKSIYSYHEKLKNNENTNDLFAVRIVVDQVLDCYLALGIVHTNFYNIDNTFKDFISKPKINLYQSLHTVVNFKGLTFEIQIRTKDMDHVANYGIASHWKYKENHHEFDINLEQLSTIIQNCSKQTTNKESLGLIRKIAKQKFVHVHDLNTDDWKKIPENTKLIDYAYTIDKQNFEYIEDFLVNGNPEKMFYIIQPGDRIKIGYSSNKTINKQWEYISNDAIVKKHIHDTLIKLNSYNEKIVNEFIDEVSRNSDGQIGRDYVLDFIQKQFKINTINDFFECMSIINIQRSELLKLFAQKSSEKRALTQRIQQQSWKWIMHRSLFEANEIAMFESINITDCCSKIPPLEVVGILNGRSLNVHRFNCPRINPNKDKMVVLKWSKEKIKRSSRSFKAKITMNGLFSPDVSTSIISVITRYKGVISKFDLSKNKTSKEFEIHADIYVKNYSNVEKMMDEMLAKGIIHGWKLI